MARETPNLQQVYSETYARIIADHLLEKKKAAIALGGTPGFHHAAPSESSSSRWGVYGPFSFPEISIMPWRTWINLHIIFPLAMIYLCLLLWKKIAPAMEHPMARVWEAIGHKINSLRFNWVTDRAYMYWRRALYWVEDHIPHMFFSIAAVTCAYLIIFAPGRPAPTTQWLTWHEVRRLGIDVPQWVLDLSLRQEWKQHYQIHTSRSCSG